MELRWKVVLLGVVSLLAAAGWIAVVVQREGKALAVEQVKLGRKVFASLPVDPQMEKDLRALVDGAIRTIPDLDRETRDPKAVLKKLRAYSDRDFGQIRWPRIRSIEPLPRGGRRLDGEAQPAVVAL